MATTVCPECDGTKKCRNRVHSSLVDILIGEATGDECEDCNQTAGDPGDCPECGGTGEIEQDDRTTPRPDTKSR
jgi:hypothetical protein